MMPMLNHVIRACAVAMVCLSTDGSVFAGPPYALTDLGTLGGGSAIARGLNNAGQVVGDSTTASGDTFAFVWQAGTMLALPTPVGSDSRAYAINNRGQVAGGLSVQPIDTGDSSAVLWDLGDFGAGPLDIGAPRYSWGRCINDAGHIAGYGLPLSRSGWQAFFWSLQTGSNYLPKGPGMWQESQAYGINGSDQVAGYQITTAWDPALWDNGTVTDLGTLGAQATGIAYATNESGVVVGFSDLPTANLTPRLRAIRWMSGVGMKSLGTLDPKYVDYRVDYVQSEALAINQTGEIVGLSYDGVLGERAVIWTNGELYDLNTLIPPTTGWTLTIARAINDAGQIAGEGIYQGQTRAFLLTPVVPSARQALGAAGGLISTSPADVSRLHGASTGSVGIVDAVRLARRASGLDP